MSLLARGVATVVDPPLDPSPDEARDALRRELLNPRYHDQNLVDRLLRWVSERIDGTVEAASATPSASWFAVTILLVLLVVALAWIASRARRSARGGADVGGVLPEEQVSARELRARAERALAEGRCSDALLDGFRATALAQVERGRLASSPGLTAHEVARSMAADAPDAADVLHTGADLFDGVRYGDREASADQARLVLGLDERLRARR